MATNDPCVVVLQLTGGNDYLNSMIPTTTRCTATTVRRWGSATTRSSTSTRTTASRTTWRR